MGRRSLHSLVSHHYVHKSQKELYFYSTRFSDILLQASETYNLTDEYLQAEVDTFMFEGHDTTANAMSFATYLLARYPEVQTRVRNELDEIFAHDLGKSNMYRADGVDGQQEMERN